MLIAAARPALIRPKAAAALVSVNSVSTANGPLTDDTSWTVPLPTLAASDDMAIAVVMLKENDPAPTLAFGGNAPTGVVWTLNTGTVPDMRVGWAWWLNADLPTPGSNVNLVVTFGTTNNRGFAAIAALSGAEQATPGTDGASGTGTAASAAALTAAGGSLIGVGILVNASNDITPDGAGWNVLFDANHSAATNWGFGGYLTDQSGSVDPGGTWTGSTEWVLGSIRVDPA